MITVGADPEFFVENTETGRLVSAQHITEGTKYDHEPIGDGIEVHADGHAFEVNLPPASIRNFFSDIDSHMRTISEYLQKKGPYRLSKKVFGDFSHELGEVPDDAWVLGCDPDKILDFSYSGMGTYLSVVDRAPPVFEGPHKYYRTSSGHVHVGFVPESLIGTYDHTFDAAYVVYSLHRGLNSMTIEEIYRNRYYPSRTLRIKPYGVEWRGLSNRWIFDSSKRNSLVYGLDQLAYDLRSTVV